MSFAARFSHFVAFCVLILAVSENCEAQTTVRPYKFGFTIEEQQHRYEKRDERGIVMGEFGFITADGIYHVTVYATDEEGKFRILAMKNYPYTSPPKTIDMIIKPKMNPPTTISTTTITTTTQRPKFPTGQEGCSGCFIPNKKEKPDLRENAIPKTEIRPLSKPLEEELKPIIKTMVDIERKVKGTVEDGLAIANEATKSVISKKQNNKHNTNTKINANTKTNTNTITNTIKYKNEPTQPNTIDLRIQTSASNIRNINTKYTNSQQKLSSIPPTREIQPPIGSGQDPSLNPALSNAGDASPPASNPSFPVLPSSSSSAVGAVNSRTPSVVKPIQVDGASGSAKPKVGKTAGSVGVTGGGAGNADDSGDLYRFKYILDYNGHTETGSRNGNKQGNFFSIGDDNVERTIEYIANEFGYQPRIRWRKLNADEIKAKENSLKDYEFVWFKQP